MELPDGTYPVREQLTAQIEAWKRSLNTIVEITAYTDTGISHSQVFLVTSVDDYDQPDNFRVHGVTLWEQDPQHVLLCFYKNVWDITLRSVPSEPRPSMPRVYRVLAAYTKFVYGLLIGWAVLGGFFVVVGTISLLSAVMQGMLTGMCIALSSTVLWILLPRGTFESRRRLGFVFGGIGITGCSLMAGLALHVF
jgi:hypothetical protein